MTTRSTTPPAALAVSLAAAKESLRILHDDLDASIDLWIRSITEEAEHTVGRSFINQGWRLSLDAFPDALRLDHPPIASVESVRYYDENNVLQTLDPADYLTDLVSEPGYIVPGIGKAWPATFDRVHAVIVDYTAGYGATDASVPAGAKQYILAKLSVQYDPASGGAAATVAQPYNVSYLDRLLDKIRNYG